MRIERVFNIAQKLEPVWWGVCEVVPLRGEDGRALAYCERGLPRGLSELPAEMFNHEMMGVDASDPDQMAAFMSDYGLLGFRPERRHRIVPSILDIEGPDDVRRVDETYGLYESHCGRPCPWRSLDEEMVAWYASLRDALRREGYSEISRDGLNPYCADFLYLMTAEEVRESFECLLRSGLACAAVAKYQEVNEVRDYLNGLSYCKRSLFDLGDERETVEEVRRLDRFLVGRLAGMTPKIGFIEVAGEEGGEGAYRRGPASYEDEFAESEGGCLDLAIALQIYNFAQDSSRCKVCDYCGKVFVEKRSPGRKGAPRVSSFCSDSCQNSKKQKEYRQRQEQKRRAASRARVP